MPHFKLDHICKAFFYISIGLHIGDDFFWGGRETAPPRSDTEGGKVYLAFLFFLASNPKFRQSISGPLGFFGNKKSEIPD